MHWFLSRRQVVTTGKDALSTQRQTVSFGGWAGRGQRGVQNIVQAYISSYRWSHGGLASAWDLPRITLLLCGRISSALDSPGCQHISACTVGHLMREPWLWTDTRLQGLRLLELLKP